MKMQRQPETVRPLQHDHYAMTQVLGTKQIILEWSGSYDERFLDVHVIPFNPVLHNLIEKWAWGVYNQNGMSSSHGDRVIYDLVTKRVSVTGWLSEITGISDTELGINYAEVELAPRWRNRDQSL